jgi:hypothetical protein
MPDAGKKKSPAALVARTGQAQSTGLYTLPDT